MVKSVKLMLKILGVVLVSVFMIQTYAMMGFASDESNANVVIVIPNDGVTEGDEFDVPVYFSGNPGFAGVNLDVLYDQTKFSYVSAAVGPLFTGGMFVPNGMAPGTVTIVFVNATTISGDGVMFTIRLRALGDTAFDEESFSVEYLGKGIADAAGDKIDTAEVVAPPAPMKSYTPVTLTQTGNVDDGNVQYRTAAQVANALPRFIEAQLDGGIGSALIPVVWSSTSTPAYNPNTAGFYTFSATWGAIPPVTNNDSNLAAPTCVVEVKQSPATVGNPTSESSVYGEKTLDQIALTPDPADEIAGTWAWNEPDAVSIYPKVGTAYQAVFTPNDGSVSRTRAIMPTVAPKSITVTITPVTIKYGQTVPSVFAATAQPGSFVGTDTVNDLNLTFSTNAPTNPSVAGSPYNVTGTANNANYSVTVEGTGALIVAQATVQTITTTVGNEVKTAYEARGYANTSAIASWLLPDTVDVSTDTGFASLSIVWSTTDMYNAQGAEYTFTGVPLSNADISVPAGISVSANVTVTPIGAVLPIFTDADIVKTGNAAMTASDIRTISSDLLPVSGNVVIEGESIAFSIDWNGGQTLDGATIGATQTFTGTVTYSDAPDWLTISGGNTASRKITVTDRQTTTITLTDPVDAVYGTAFVPPAASSAEGGSVFDYTYSGVANDGTTVENVSLPPVKAGNYSVTATLVSDMYFGSASKDFSIIRKSVNAVVSVASKVYGAANPPFSVVYNGLAYTDTDEVFTDLALATTATILSPVGMYDVTFIDGTTTAQTDNYSVTLDGLNSLEITKKPVVVMAVDMSRAYLAVNPVFDFTFGATDLVEGDSKDDLAVTLSTVATATSNVGEYPITGTSASLNYAVTVEPGTLTVTKITQSAPVTLTLSQNRAIFDVTEEKLSASASGGSGTGTYTFISSNEEVAKVEVDGTITMIGVGTTEITAFRAGNQNYLDSEISSPVVLTVLPKVDLTVENTAASGEHLINAKNQDKVSFGDIVRIPGTNDFTLTITGADRLESYASVNETQGTGCWVGALIGNPTVPDITNLWVKTSSSGTYTRLTSDDVDEAANAGGTDSFVYWFKATDSDSGSSHEIFVATDAEGVNEANLKISFIPFSDDNLIDAQNVAADKAALNWDRIKGANSTQTSVTSNLALPISGENGSSITWVSSDPSIVSATGVVSRPSSGTGNRSVTLTAVISSGDVSDTAEFLLTVLARPYTSSYTPTPPPTTSPGATILEDTQTPLTGIWNNPYSDVADTDWFFDAVRFLTEIGLSNGTAADKFSPNAAMTRAMIVTLLYRLEGEPTVSGSIPFADVNSGQWYSNAILWASRNDIVNGYSNGTFGINDPVTREQAVTILYRYAKFKDLDVSATADLSGYTDMDDISDWALDAMKWAVSVGIVQGRTAATIEPQGTSTRAEVAAILKRYVEDFLSESDENRDTAEDNDTEE